MERFVFDLNNRTSHHNPLKSKGFTSKRTDLIKQRFVLCPIFADISTLKREHVVTDDKGEMWIRKAREKTDELSVIPMLEIPRKLMEKYKGHPRVVEKDGVIPVISNQRMNSYLDEIGSKAEIKKHLTTHIARHTELPLSLKLNGLQRFVSCQVTI